METKMKVSPLVNILGIISFSFLSLVATNLELNLAQADNQQAQQPLELAVANEVLINASPRQDQVAERYLKEATGLEDITVVDSSYSAITLYIPLNEELPVGAIIEQDEIDDTCKDFQGYIRGLRRDNAEKRKQDQKPTLVYNLQCGANSIVTASALPNDQRLSELWGSGNSINNIDLDLPEAWDKATGSRDVIVAVIDSGVDYNHPDLVENMWKNPAELNGVAGADDDNNGVIDDIYGLNAIDNSGNPFDDNNHGTHVAGTIGAAGNNGLGVVGVNWKVKLMAVKFLSSSGSGTMAGAVKAIDYVTNAKIAGANIVASNNSWGGTGTSPALSSSISRANNANILFIAAAGNEGSNIDSVRIYPASYTQSNIISVGAVSANGSMPYWSNYGLESVDIVAPGDSILSCLPNNAYGYLSGTSMATPQVSGAIALLKAYAPSMTITQLKDTLFNTSKNVPAAVGKTKYGSMPNVFAMLLEADRLQLSDPPTPAPTAAPTGVPTATPTATATPTPTSTPLPSPTATISPTPAPGRWTVEGVVRAGERNLALAKVKLEINGQIQTTYTDANGAFRFKNILGSTNYTISVISAGYSFTSASGLLLSNVNVNIYGVAKNYTLRALVTNKNGQPLAGVVVADLQLGARTTSSQGVVEFTIPFGTDYELSVWKDDNDFLQNSLTGQIVGDVTRAFVMLPQ